MSTLSTMPTIKIDTRYLIKARLSLQIDDKRAERVQRAIVKDRGLELLPGSVKLSDALSHFLAAQAKPGTHHDLRLALSALAIKKRLGTRELWVRAMSEAWGDPIDAAAAWDSTAQRLASGQPTLGIAFVKDALGGAHLVQLMAALATALCCSFTTVLERVGLSRTYVPAELPATIRSVVEDPELKGVLAKRVERVPFCGTIRRDERCLDCAKGRCSHKLTCQTPQLCSHCSFASARRLAEWCEQHWPKQGKYLLTDAAYDTREVACLARKRAGSPLASVTPIPPGRAGGPVRWRVLAVSVRGTSSAGAAAGLAGATNTTVSKHEAINAVAQALLQPWACVRDLLERGRGEDAAQLLAQLYNKRTVYRSQSGDSLPWPRAAELRAEARAKLEEKRLQDPDACACPTMGVYDTVYEPTNEVLIAGAAWPTPFKEAVTCLLKGAEAGMLAIHVEKIETPCLRL